MAEGLRDAEIFSESTRRDD